MTWWIVSGLGVGLGAIAAGLWLRSQSRYWLPADKKCKCDLCTNYRVIYRVIRRGGVDMPPTRPDTATAPFTRGSRRP